MSSKPIGKSGPSYSCSAFAFYLSNVRQYGYFVLQMSNCDGSRSRPFFRELRHPVSSLSSTLAVSSSGLPQLDHLHLHEEREDFRSGCLIRAR